MDDETARDIENRAREGDFSYDIWGDKKAIREAKKVIAETPYEELRDSLIKKFESDIMLDKGDVTRAALLHNVAIKNGDAEGRKALTSAIALNAKTAGQAIQAMTLLNKLDGKGIVY